MCGWWASVLSHQPQRNPTYARVRDDRTAPHRKERTDPHHPRGGILHLQGQPLNDHTYLSKVDKTFAVVERLIWSNAGSVTGAVVGGILAPKLRRTAEPGSKKARTPGDSKEAPANEPHA